MKLPIKYSKTHWIDRKKAREEYIKLQDGLCYHCNKPLNGSPSVKVVNALIDKALFPPDMFKYPIHLHHSHKDDMTIGAVHSRCNAVLWQYHGE